MADQSIGRSILSIPKPNVFLGDKNATVAVARHLNENSAAPARVLPRRPSFFATSAPPYVEETITETIYALETLGAVGVALTSNHEGKYLGNPEFHPFFAQMEAMNAIIFVHPANPLLETAGIFVLTARTFVDLALSRTLQNFTHVNFIIPHVNGGSLPSIIDRSITGRASPDDCAAIMHAFCTRYWWDSAGITYTHQLGGLLAYNISSSFLLYGLDYPRPLGTLRLMRSRRRYSSTRRRNSHEERECEEIV
ncbi:hypothetical protein B0H19DRAFT_134469 [Mycena capillaripes]|nr:hypothetical protein B0H19DRAFT_134469 [Mycena capillaripes]